MSTFLSHPQVIDVLNKLNVSLGAIQPGKPMLGTSQFVGRVYRPYFDLYGYAESYELEETPGTLKAMVPEDSALLGCSTSQAVTSLRMRHADRSRRADRDLHGRKIRSATTQRTAPGISRTANSDPPLFDPLRPVEWAVINPLT